MLYSSMAAAVAGLSGDALQFVALALSPRPGEEFSPDDFISVQLLGIDANPDATAVSDVMAYSRSHAMVNQWDFLTGSPAQLHAVWKAYHIYVQIVRGDIDHVGDQPGIGFLGKLDDRHHVGRFETRNPVLPVDRIRRDNRPPGDGFRCNVGAAATPAGRPRRVEEVAAAVAPGDQQLAVAPTGPERMRLGGWAGRQSQLGTLVAAVR